MITTGDKRGTPVTPLPAARDIKALPMMVGGHCAIDFINPGARLLDRDSFADFCLVQGLLSEAEQWHYRTPKISKPPETLPIDELAELQETLAHLLNARIDGRKPEPIYLRRMERMLREAMATQEIRVTPTGYRLTPVEQSYRYQLPIHRLALAAMDLLADLPPDRLRRCAADGCGWLFLDSSKSGRRRWCSMSDCGNQTKQRRFRTKPVPQ